MKIKKRGTDIMNSSLCIVVQNYKLNKAIAITL